MSPPSARLAAWNMQHDHFVILGRISPTGFEPEPVLNAQNPRLADIHHCSEPLNNRGY